MSESYPKSNAWPFVLSGLLLFGLVLSPPTEWSSAVRNLYANWIVTYKTEAADHQADRVVVVHDPWKRQPKDIVVRQNVLAAPLKELAAAPTVITKTVSIGPTAVDLPPQRKERVAVATVQTADNPAAFRSRYVWQPPTNWVPRLIEPLPKQSIATDNKQWVAALEVAPVADPVAKLEPSRRPRRPLPSAPITPSLSNLIDPLDLGANKPEPRRAAEDSLPTIDKTELAEEVTPIDEPVVINDSAPTGNPIARRGQQGGAWHFSRNLQDLIGEGEELGRLEKWSKQLRCRLDQFNSKPLHGDSNQIDALERITALANYPVDISSWQPLEQQTYWRIRHAIQRRTDVWKPLLKTASSETEHVEQMRSQLSRSAEKLSENLWHNPGTEPWATYLRLEQLTNNSNVDHANLHEAAERTLGLLRNGVLGAKQKDFLSAQVFREFEAELRAVISANVSATDVVEALERYEDNANAINSKAVIACVQRFGTGPYTERFVPALQAIDTHYRNANVRVAVSQDLMNRFVPAFHKYAEQVNDTILGAAVRGRNSTLTNLSVELIPDPSAIHVGLLANGMVDSDTASRKGPVVVYNRGTSRFAAGKELLIGPNGIFLGQTETRATTGNRLVGMKTDLDQYPFLGWLVRNLARQEHDKQRPFLRAEVLQRVRNGASRKMDVDVQQRLANVENRVQSQVVQPLRELNLDPRTMEMSTTKDRAILRTRLAGPLQLGAHSPRPQARADSKMSFQLHQSAANNMVEQFNLQGRRMTLGELATELSNRFGMDIEIAEQRRDTIVEFASGSPLDFKFEDGQIQVTINFAELFNGEDRWTNFSVRGFYRADVRQMEVELIRDGSIELITESLRLRDQIALRGIFTKVFANNQRFDLLRRAIQDQPKLRSLTVSQFAIRDGWIAMSLGEKSELAHHATTRR